MQILIRAPKELKEILQGMAKAMGVTLNAFILQILWDFIKSNGKQYSAHKGKGEMMNQAELNDILEKHKKWLNGDEGGGKADLQGANLTG